MNNLTLAVNNTAVTNQPVMMSSFELTQVIEQNKDREKSKKEIQHKTVIRAIDTMLEKLGHGTHEYHDKNQSVTITNGVILKTDYRGYKSEYLLDHDHAVCLVAGFSTKIRMAVVRRLRELEEATAPKIPQTYEEALEATLIEVRKVKQLTLENQEKEALLIQQEAEHEMFVDTFFDESSSISIGTFAKITGVLGQKQMFEYLRNSGVMMASLNRNEPYQKYMHHFVIRGQFSTPLLKCTSAKWLLNRMVKDNLISKSKKDMCYDDIKAKYSDDLDVVLEAAFKAA